MGQRAEDEPLHSFVGRLGASVAEHVLDGIHHFG